MAILGIHKGSWAGLPDFGITERVQKIVAPQAPRTAQGGSNVLGARTNAQAPSYPWLGGGSPSILNVKQPQPQPKPTGYTPSVNNSIPQSNPIQDVRDTYQGMQDQISNEVNDYGAILESEYNNAINYLGQQEEGLKSQANLAQQQIGSEFGNVSAQLGQEQQTRTQGVQDQQQTAETEAKNALQQARDVYRQTQQRNIAQLSSLGLSSSSVTEALAEKLGVETARRIAGVTGSLSEVRQNAAKEMARINDYYSQKKTTLEKTKAIEIGKIQNTLMSGLNQISYARGQAAADKARARFDLLQNAQNQINSIKQQALQFELSLQQWAQTKAKNLNDVYSNPNWVNDFMSQKSTLEESFSPSQYDLSPTINQSTTGKWSGSWKVAPKKKEVTDIEW